MCWLKNIPWILAKICSGRRLGLVLRHFICICICDESVFYLLLFFFFFFQHLCICISVSVYLCICGGIIDSDWWAARHLFLFHFIYFSFFGILFFYFCNCNDSSLVSLNTAKVGMDRDEDEPGPCRAGPLMRQLRDKNIIIAIALKQPRRSVAPGRLSAVQESIQFSLQFLSIFRLHHFPFAFLND